VAGMIFKREMASWIKSLTLALGIASGAAATCEAACYGPQQQLPSQAVNDFVANPSQLLQQYPNGGPLMISRIRDLAASNPSALPGIQALIASANADQKTALGTGLGQAARICVNTDRDFANQLQTAAAGDADVRLAYQAVVGDIATAAAGTGAGGGGPGGGVATGGALTGSSTGGSFQVFGNSGVNTLSFSYSPSTGSGPGAPSFSSPVINSTAGSVSP
jgi:hypothetical protein